MRMRTVGAAVVSLAAWAGTANADDQAPSYVKDVKPFLAKYCAECHSGSRAKSGYSVESLATLTKSGRRGALVVPEKPDQSRLLLTMAGMGKAMPPRRSAQPMPDEIAKVREWIKAGAKDDTPADDKKKPGLPPR